MASEREFEAFQGFLLGCKLHWTTEMFGELKRTYERNLEAAGASTGEPGPERVSRLLEGEVIEDVFAWFERHLQRMKYSGRLGLVPFHETRRDELLADLSRTIPDGLLRLDPDLAMPRYYESIDVHQHPGGVWSDEIAGLVYERGARSTTPLLGRDKDLHRRFVDAMAERQPTPRRVLDMACGFGKTTKPLYETFREAEVVGLDLSAPCLKLAALQADEAQARNVRFVQADAAATGLEDAGFDLVTSTMFLHEMPPPYIRRVLAESHRLLAPGGLMIHLDFLPPEDEFLAYAHFGHGRRNNEPFMEPLAKMGIADAVAEAGFSGIEILPFEESPGALAERGQKWRFPWTIIAARKEG